MARPTFDIVTVGGGLGGAPLARAMAERGARVLVLERERRFAGRVRGEAPVPWGVADGEAIPARLVVGADGRSSLMRKWAGFPVRRDPERLLFSGVLLDGVPAPEDAAAILFSPGAGRIGLVIPQGGGRVRAYVGYHRDADPPRAPDLGRFLEESVRTGAAPTLWA